eukprot:c45079_g1_i1 orf=186-677(+)
MGQSQGKAATDEHIRRITDRVFDYFAHQAQTDKLRFQELYTAVLLVYNDLNKHIPGPHYDPPTREEVHDIFQKFDKNKDEELSKEEFALFMETFTSKILGTLGRTFLVLCILAPALAFLAKRGTEGLPRVGNFVRGIPFFVYTSLVTAGLILAERMFQGKWKA